MFDGKQNLSFTIWSHKQKFHIKYLIKNWSPYLQIYILLYISMSKDMSKTTPFLLSSHIQISYNSSCSKDLSQGILCPSLAIKLFHIAHLQSSTIIRKHLSYYSISLIHMLCWLFWLNENKLCRTAGESCFCVIQVKSQKKEAVQSTTAVFLWGLLFYYKKLQSFEEETDNYSTLSSEKMNKLKVTKQLFSPISRQIKC